MMKSNKGQALVEFIMIIPIFIFILLAIVDFGNIIYQKYQLENNIDTIADMYVLGDNTIDDYLDEISSKISYEKHDKYTTIKLEKNIQINTPGLNNIIGKNYKILAEKTIYDGDKGE